MKKDILIALLTNNDDDIYCFRKELIEGLITEGYKILISCPYGQKFKLMSGIEYIYDNPNIDRRGTNIINDLKLLIHYYKLLKRYRPSVALTYTAKPNVYAGIVANMLNIPVINNLTGLGSVINETKIRKKFIMSLFRYAYKRSACIMFQNETNMKKAIDSNMVKGDYMLLPGSGVNTDRFPFQPLPAAGDGIVGPPVIFNYIGRVLKDKRIDDFLEAAKQIKKKYPKTIFNIIGFIEPTESHYEMILNYLQEDGIVNYCGSTDNIHSYIIPSHCTIHPSTYGEGMSNVLLESASSGRPIITTNNPGCQEVVEDNVTGFIYKGEDIDALVKTIERFLSLTYEQKQRMGELGRARMVQSFSRKVVVDAYKCKIKHILDTE